MKWKFLKAGYFNSPYTYYDDSKVNGVLSTGLDLPLKGHIKRCTHDL